MTARGDTLDRAALLAEARRLRARLAEPESSAGRASAPAKNTAARPDLSVMFFSADAGDGSRSPYSLVLEAARRADRAGLHAVWLPERHFEAFGGPYPNPAVLAAAVARETARIRIRAGSVIIPLHDPIEVAEAWAMVDQLSGGRVDIAFGSGWNPTDFALRPRNFADSKAAMRDGIAEFRTLWRGGAVTRADGKGAPADIRTQPRPAQPDPGLWIAATGNPETFAWAGRSGFNVLTMVLGGSLDDVAARIATYRAARAEAGLDPAAGRVTLMLHTHVDPDRERLLARVRGPMTEYVRGALDLHAKAAGPDEPLDDGQRDRMADFAFQRYLRTASLIGTPEEAAAMLARTRGIGVDEIACLLDFGLDEAHALEGLDRLIALAGPQEWPEERPEERSEARSGAPAAIDPESRKAAILGVACRLPGAPDHPAFVAALRSGASALSDPPLGRWPVADPALRRGGFIGDVERFDPAPFRLAPAEAAVMDPHQRLFLECVWHALEDAGLRPSDLRGRPVGVFAAMYSTSYLQRRPPSDDPLAVPGGLASMVANRTSFVFDWRGPSETIDTACSSGLVAVHRALRALRDGECEIAVVGGVSLLLSDLESARLSDLGVLAADGVCRAFDADAGGQARGEGMGVLVLTRLDLARRDGARVRAVIAGSAVSHAGGAAASLTLPSSTGQARAVVYAWRDAGAAPGSGTYVEAHGAGTAHGDRSEVSAFRAALSTLGAQGGELAVGTVKPAIGSLDACGGIAGLIAAAAAVEHGFRPGHPALDKPAPDLGLDEGGIRLLRDPEPWPAPDRRAGVHAYGLGGVSAHVVVEAAASAPPLARPDAGIAVCPVFAWDAAGIARQRLVLANWLVAHPETDLPGVAATLANGREPMAARWVAVASDTDGLIRLLRGEVGPLAVAPGVDRDDPAVRRARGILDGADPTDGDRPGVALPGYAFAPTRFPIEGGPIEGGGPAPQKGAVARYYDYVAAAGGARAGPLYLTLAPFPEVVPGFSWTRTMRDPAAHPEHAALIRAAQLEMRETLLADVAFERVGHVLDIGCGFATDLMDIAAAHPHLRATGYTIAPAQAEAAAARVVAAGLAERVEILNRDSARDPFPGPFDLAIGYEVGHHVEDKDGLFANLAQALVAGGTLALIDCAADTARAIHLPEVGSWTSTLGDYADILARHGFRLTRVVDASREVGNFLVDPGLETMLAGETADGAEHVARVQRSWDGFGAALREGLIRYLLITAERLPEGAAPPVAWNRSRMGVAR